MRDIEDRGRDLEQVLHQYTTLVKPAFEEFCLPVSFQTSQRYSAYFIDYGIKAGWGHKFFGVEFSNLMFTFDIFQTKKHADVIIPRGADNTGG